MPKKDEYCGDKLYDDIYSAFHALIAKMAVAVEARSKDFSCSGETNKLIKIIQPKIEEIKKNEKEATKELKKAVKYLDQGKKIFMPNTTNSFVDDFLEKHKNLL